MLRRCALVDSPNNLVHTSSHSSNRHRWRHRHRHMRGRRYRRNDVWRSINSCPMDKQSEGVGNHRTTSTLHTNRTPTQRHHLSRDARSRASLTAKALSPNRQLDRRKSHLVYTRRPYLEQEQQTSRSLLFPSALPVQHSETSLNIENSSLSTTLKCQPAPCRSRYRSG